MVKDRNRIEMLGEVARCMYTWWSYKCLVVVFIPDKGHGKSQNTI